jgi:hypothetical protein
MISIYPYMPALGGLGLSCVGLMLGGGIITACSLFILAKILGNLIFLTDPTQP